MAAPEPVRLIATDLDGTLLQPDLSVTPRTRAALDAARAAGIEVVPVTARAPIGLRAIADQAGFDSWALCGNGAYGLRVDTGEVLFERTLPVEVVRTLAGALLPRLPGVLFASVRDAGETFVAQEGYAALVHPSDHSRMPDTMGGEPLDVVLGTPCVKLVIRHPHVPPAEIFALVQSLSLPGFEATTSGAPFVEVMAAGVTKAWGLEQLCQRLGVPQSGVLAFGDAANDEPMLRWAGHGVAMGNADAFVQAAADEVTHAHTDEGVAAVIERILAGAANGPSTRA